MSKFLERTVIASHSGHFIGSSIDESIIPIEMDFPFWMNLCCSNRFSIRKLTGVLIHFPSLPLRYPLFVSQGGEREDEATFHHFPTNIYILLVCGRIILCTSFLVVVHIFLYFLCVFFLRPRYQILYRICYFLNWLNYVCSVVISITINITIILCFFLPFLPLSWLVVCWKVRHEIRW